MPPLSQDLKNSLMQAKQKGLISHTQVSPFGLNNQTGPNEPDEPINQTLSGIVTVLIIILLIMASVAIAIYFLK